MVLTGAKKREDIYRAFENIYPVLQTFRKGGELMRGRGRREGGGWGGLSEWAEQARGSGIGLCMCHSPHMPLGVPACCVCCCIFRYKVGCLTMRCCVCRPAGMIAAPEAPAALPAPQQQQQALPVVGAPAPHL